MGVSELGESITCVLGVIPADTYKYVGGRATQEAKAEAGTQSNNVPPGSMPRTPIRGRTNFTGYRISPADFPV